MKAADAQFTRWEAISWFGQGMVDRLMLETPKLPRDQADKLRSSVTRARIYARVRRNKSAESTRS